MKFYFILVGLFFSFLATAQNPNEKIQWQKERPLEPEDFRARPPKNSFFAGKTNSGISYSWSLSTGSEEDVLEYEIRTNFYPNLSWLKEVEDEAYLLAHERLHFDITELHARKLRKAMAEFEISPDVNVKRELNMLYRNSEKQKLVMQKRYDKETNHSKNREAELWWRKFIARELEKFKKYSSSRIKKSIKPEKQQLQP